MAVNKKHGGQPFNAFDLEEVHMGFLHTRCTLKSAKLRDTFLWFYSVILQPGCQCLKSGIVVHSKNYFFILVLLGCNVNSVSGG